MRHKQGLKMYKEVIHLITIVFIVVLCIIETIYMGGER